MNRDPKLELGTTRIKDPKIPSPDSSKGSISPPVMGIIEMGNPSCILSNLLASSSEVTVLGESSVYVDPMLEAWRRMLEGKAPLVIEREIVPGDPRTRETFDLKDLLIDKCYLGACLQFRLDNLDLPEGASADGFESNLKEWAGGFDVEEPLFMGD